MDAEVYKHPGRNGNVRVVYNGGGIVEVDPWGMARPFDNDDREGRS